MTHAVDQIPVPLVENAAANGDINAPYRRFLSVEQEHELRDWANSLGCTPEQLCAAMKVVDHSSEDVLQYLGARL